MCDPASLAAGLGCSAMPEENGPGEAAGAPVPDQAAALPVEIQALLANSNPGWNGAIGRGGVVNFSFAQSPEAGTPANGFSPLSAGQMASARLALSAWAGASGLTFVEVPDHAGGAGIDIRFMHENMSSAYAGTGEYPMGGTIRLSSALYGNGADSMVPGSYGYLVLLHEIGHTLGLKHPFDRTVGNLTVLPAALDKLANTVMSYDRSSPNPTGLQPYDLATISYIYGSQSQEPAWATSARYDADTDSVVMTGDASAETIWNTNRRSVVFAGGGNDTILGGAGDERLFGEDGNDSINGGNGANSLFGGVGNDTLYGGSGNDWLAGGSGINTVYAGAGIDTLAVEHGRRATAITITPSASATQTINGGPVPYFGGTIRSGDETTTFYTVENFAFLDGRLVYASNDPAMQVYRFYQAALGRAPDSVGQNYWTAELQAGKGLAAVAAGFVNSTEYNTRFGALDDAGFVNLTYRNVLGRAPDPTGLNYWLNNLSHGATRQDVVVNFSESSEFKTRIAATLPNGLWDGDENAASIARLYQATLGRHPDETGLRYWDTSFDNGLSLSDMAVAFTASSEFAARFGSPDNAGFINQLYVNVLGRAPDSTGFNYWKTGIDAGTLTRTDLVLAFSESTEFKTTTASWIEGGIVFA
ncbi:DUF4214 domain-containing protein [Muricoccus aerilatus]|uniref:DUF4214 domain-containing protein n=1 Tax=Muricoccus aerilatus TaxID=452982 RepID=UPI0005C1FDC6|nr:DUF4214 domain-containing protein [Roseomonas aerilata]